MGIMGTIKGLLMLDDDYDEEEVEEKVEEKRIDMPPKEPIQRSSARITPMSTAPSQAGRVVPLQPISTNAKQDVLNVSMSNYDATADVAEYIKAKKPVIANMQKLEAAEIQRAVDYLTGACEALGGSVHNIADRVFMFSPDHVNVINK
ncbi:MAG: hypothetical protein ATN36_04170 [Epulopiscium sp. Nele67-Bin005]|nr:MAG: hypothetical protein ATN36_04170 [Epulopiscium sp. Nele67-Bin005]